MDVCQSMDEEDISDEDDGDDDDDDDELEDPFVDNLIAQWADLRDKVSNTTSQISDQTNQLDFSGRMQKLGARQWNRLSVNRSLKKWISNCAKWKKSTWRE